jgi:hypothetical protein
VNPPPSGVDIPATGATGGWQKASRYSVWTKEFPASAPALTIVEALPQGLLRVPDDARLFHIVPAGTRYRLEHLFGFWRSSDVDTIVIRAAVDQTVSYTLIVRNDWPEFSKDEIVFTCPNCDAEVERFPFATPRFGIAAYWHEALQLARKVNAEYAGRACASCGNPSAHAYGIDETEDTAEERAARARW